MTTENYDWTVGFSFGEVEAEFQWREQFYEDRSMGYYGFLVADANSSEPIILEGSRIPGWLKDSLKAAACGIRRAEVRTEFARSSVELLTDEEVLISTIFKLFVRSQRGEFLGQASANSLLYVQDIAAILNLTFNHVLTVIDRLVAEGRIGLNGMILIPAKDYEAAFASWEKATGHRRLTMGDWGNWQCAACGQSGDEYNNPRDVECSAPSSFGRTPVAGVETAQPEDGAEAADAPEEAEEPSEVAEPPADCGCICHREPGVSHIMACCGGSRVEAESDLEAWLKRGE